MLLWRSVRTEFAWEGSWRDICVREVNLAAWQAAVQALIREGLRGEFTLNGVRQELPFDLREVFGISCERGALWCVSVVGLTLYCHFFDEGEIEFDLDPREVTGPERLDGIVGFMRTLASATGKPALMTPENMHEVPFLRVAPSGHAEYLSSGGFFEELARQR
jgi:hypothetical protein